MNFSFKDVKKKCIEDRFFAYDSWSDKLNVPPAMCVTWFCLKVGISAHTVSWISGLVAVVGGYLLTFDDRFIVLIGSFSYAIWLLLDYVDGAVARFHKKGSVAGQYIDWMMHVISHVAIVSGITLGAMNVAGTWILPFVILGIIASCLPYARFSMAWFSICMEQQQRRTKNLKVHMEHQLVVGQPSVKFLPYEILRRCSTILFYEKFLVISLPIFAIVQNINALGQVDFRVIFTICAGLIYFPVQAIEVHRLATCNKIQKAYSELFSPDHKPNLPDDHFFN